MSDQLPVPPGCFDDATWMAVADERADLDAATREQAQSHAEGCARCEQRLSSARRFRTLLQRSKVPGLSFEQWRSLDQRVAMLGSEPRPRGVSLGARTYWGATLAAASVALIVGAWQGVRAYLAHSDAVELAERVASETRARAMAPLQVARIEGAIEQAQPQAGASDGWAALPAGAWLAAGTRLRTGPTGARVVLPSTAELELAANSEVLVESATGRDFFVRVRRGEVALQVDKRGPDQRFAVLAGRYRASVVGTRFKVHLGDDASVAVTVVEGAVRVDEAATPLDPSAETTVVVRAGSRWHAAAGRIVVGPIDRGDFGARPAEDGAGEARSAPPVPAASARPVAEPDALQATPSARADAGRAERRDGDARSAAARRDVVIEVPHQAMSDVEIRKAKEAEAEAAARREALRHKLREPALPVP